MFWCLGMYASGSTWLFNVALKIAALAELGNVTGRFITRRSELGPLDDSDGVAIIKTHDTDPATATLLAERAQTVWISVRDPRDSVASLMQYQRLRFDLALAAVERSARFCLAHCGHPNAKLLRYETRFPDNPATLDQVAAAFGYSLAPTDRECIFTETRRDAVERLIARLELLPTAVRHPSGDVVDVKTQWHRHHANRSGETGRWRRVLAAHQTSAIEQRMQDWMAEFGYMAEFAPYRLRIGQMALRDG